MLVTDMALRDMEQGAQSLVGGLGRMLDRLRGHRVAAVSQPFSSAAAVDETGSSAILRFPLVDRAALPRENPIMNEDDRFSTAAADMSNDSPFKWRRHPQLRDRAQALDDRTDADHHRNAKAAAVRGLFLARSERLGEARAAFAQAASDDSIDLSALPGFWQLSRSAMLIAAVAYEDVDRFRDASALSARVRTKYRPRAVAPLTTTARREASGGGS